MKSSGVILGTTTALALLLVDSSAAAAFDAPQRFVSMLGIAAALVAAFFSKNPIPRISRTAFALIGVLALLLVVSAAVSPRRAIAFDTLRTIALFSSVAILSFSSGEIWKGVRRGFAVAALINAALALLQWASLFQPFQYTTVGGRANTSAFIGNSGTTGLVVAIAATILFANWLEDRRWLTAGGIALLLGALLANRALTGALVFGAGAAVLLWIESSRQEQSSYKRRIAAALLVAALLAVVGYGAAARDSLRSLNDLLSFRLFPWSAAVEMSFDRPLTGYGPGTFAAEFMPHAIDAEIRWKQRLVNPHHFGAYAEAHSDYLQALAEFGAPATIVLLVLVGMAIVRARDPLLRALLVAGAVAATTWFPMQRPAIAMLLLAAIARAFVSEESIDERSGKRAAVRIQARSTRWVFLVAAIAAIAFVIPEFSRYSGERRLARVQAAAQYLGNSPELRSGLPRIAADAARVRTFPGDWRPAVAAGTAWFGAGNADRAIEAFGSALENGERPEVDVNLGFAHAMRGDQKEASAAIVRGAWMSPALLPAIQQRTGADLRPTIAELERHLKAGTLSEVLPPAPSTNRSSRRDT